MRVKHYDMTYEVLVCISDLNTDPDSPTGQDLANALCLVNKRLCVLCIQDGMIYLVDKHDYGQKACS